MTQSTSSGAFLADVRRAAKRVRADMSSMQGRSNAQSLAMRIGQEAAALLERDARGLGTLSREVAQYWLNTSHLDECKGEEGIPEAAINRLCAMHAFLTGGDADDLNQDDWRELAGMVDDASEDLRVDTLTEMMSTLLERGALT